MGAQPLRSTDRNTWRFRFGMLAMMLAVTVISVTLGSYRLGYEWGYGAGHHDGKLARMRGRIYPRTYLVGDLIAVSRSTSSPASESTTTSDEEQLDALVELIKSTTADSCAWLPSAAPFDTGPRGRIESFPLNHSLVVAANEEVHNEVAELLRRLRILGQPAPAN